MSEGTTLRAHLLGTDAEAIDRSVADIFLDLVPVAATISREVNKAGLAGIIGHHESRNVHGEDVQKLDMFANDLMVDELQAGGRIAGMASEEVEEIIPCPTACNDAEHVIAFDPLDGSSNIDCNISIGTIFSIFRRRSPRGTAAVLSDFLQPGTEQVAAGYFLYGSSTMFVYTVGAGVHGFTLDPSTGDFRLSHENIRTPVRATTYSCNEGNSATWDAGTRDFIAGRKQPQAATGKPYSARYVGSLVADVHRNLLKGGIFLYPADRKDPDKPAKGKLRLMYEANPMAFIAEQAGGGASDGVGRIMEIMPDDVHQRVPLIVGSADDVREYNQAYTAATKATG
ncbi:MAG: fructose-1,6-bisphosphatase I [Hyphomicrobiaceae bacterium]|jgi:fructose-1,6-bisphosphatase I